MAIRQPWREAIGNFVRRWCVHSVRCRQLEEKFMRAVLLILIVGVVALIILVATGLVDISQTRGARAPQIEAENGAIRAQGGQTPAFEVQTGSVEVGTRDANVS